MAKILVTGCGGSTGIEIQRSLRRSGSDFHMIGCDCTWYGLEYGKHFCDEVVELPEAEDGAYPDAIRDLIGSRKVDVIFVNSDAELTIVPKLLEGFDIATAHPAPAITEICLDKFVTHQHIGSEGNLFPKTVSIDSDEDLIRAFDILGDPLWLRPRIGAGGRGAIAIGTPEKARVWIELWRDMGISFKQWMAQELLPGRSFNWTGIFFGGKLYASAVMERMSYFLGRVTLNGITGQTGQGRTVNAPEVDHVSLEASQRLDPNITGVLSIDLREDKNGRPRINEINPRFAGRPWLFTEAGLNLPAIFVQLCVRPEERKSYVSPRVKSNIWLARQLDIEPVIQEREF
jgi:carbamoyl-phosphate synthase large subunit